MDNFFQTCPARTDNGFRDLTDYQSATRRNEYIKYINNISRDDQYRLFLQLNAKEISDREWDYNRKNYSCWVSPCIHKFPTRATNQNYFEEMQLYNSLSDKRTNEMLKQYTTCKKYDDYRMAM